MGTLGTLVKWVVLLPVLIVILLLAIANGQPVTVHLNPFDTGDPVLQVQLALYQLAFILFAAGVLAGALVAWGSQRRGRSAARRRDDETAFRQPRAERQAREDFVRKGEEARPSPAATAYLPRPERS